MSEDAENTAAGPEPEAAGGAQPEAPSEEELRAQLEEEIKKVRVEDVVLQGLVPVLNLAARRIAKDDERDLAQGKAGIEAARALVAYIPEDAREQIQEAITQLQLLYAKYAGGEGGGSGEEPGPSQPPPEQGKKAAGGESGLWTPHQR